MKNEPLLLFVFFFLFNAQEDALGQRSWTFNLMLGDAYCFNMPLVLEQEGYEKIKFTAHYHTQSFKLPVYYSLKIGTFKEKKGWELELIHLKIFLTNNPPEVQHFEISHGYNYLTINRIINYDCIIFRFGAGLVISNPESTVRNLNYDTSQGFLNSGYHISGPGLQVAAEKRFPVYKGFYFSVEAKAAAAVAKVGITEGHALVPQAGFHGLVGIGYTWKSE